VQHSWVVCTLIVRKGVVLGRNDVLGWHIASLRSASPY